MAKKWEKFFRKVQPHLRKKLLQTLLQIVSNNMTWLDIKKIVGRENTYRCRVGGIRIIFDTYQDTPRILDVDFRGNVY